MASSSSVVPIEQKEGDYPNAGPTLQELTARAPEIGFKTKIPVDGKQSPIQKFPILGDVTLSSGQRVPCPYHNYRANSFSIWGTGDAEYIKSLIRGPWVPILDPSGRAHVVININKFLDTSLGAYEYMGVSFICLHESKTLNGRFGPVSDQADLLRLTGDSIAHVYAYKCWENNKAAVDYGRELTGYDCYYEPDGRIDLADKKSLPGGAAARLTVNFKHVPGERNDPGDGATEGTLIKGSVTLDKGMSMGVLCKYMSAFGCCRALRLSSGAGIASWQCVCPPGIMTSGPGVTHNPIYFLEIQVSDPCATPITPDNKFEYGGELGAGAIGFTAGRYIYDKANSFIWLLPHTYVDARKQ